MTKIHLRDFEISYPENSPASQFHPHVSILTQIERIWGWIFLNSNSSRVIKVDISTSCRKFTFFKSKINMGEMKTGPWLVKPLFPISRRFRHVPHFGSSFFIKIIFLNLESISAKIRNFSWGKPSSRDLRFFGHHLWFSCQPYLSWPCNMCSSWIYTLKVTCFFDFTKYPKYIS